MREVKVKKCFFKDGYIHLKLKNKENYEMIYRAAKGVYWDEETSTLFYKGKVSPAEAIKFISEAMKNEYYITLEFWFVLSIDKNQDEYIDMGTSKIRVFPDNAEDIKNYARKTSLNLLEEFETELAIVFVFEKI